MDNGIKLRTGNVSAIRTRSSVCGKVSVTCRPCQLVRSNTEDRKCRGDLLEFRKRRIFVHGHVRSRSRCLLQINPQDGCALVGGNLFELDLLTAAAPDNRPSTGCTYVVDPLNV